MKILRCLKIWGLSMLTITLITASGHSRELQKASISVEVMQTMNTSGYEVWHSRFYPIDVLEEKITSYCISQLKRSPFIRIYNETASTGQAKKDISLQLEIYSLLEKDKDFFVQDKRSTVRMRMKLYDTLGTEIPYVTSVVKKDQRIIPSPGDDRLFFLSARGFSPFDPLYKDGIDLFRLAPREDKNNFTHPVWDDFKHSTTWAACKKAIDAMLDEVTEGFTGLYHTASILRSITTNDVKGKEKSTPHVQYIISAGHFEGIKKGDILTVFREKTYKGISSNKHETTFPEEVGKVVVVQVSAHNAIVETVLKEEGERDEVTLSDMVFIPVIRQ